MTRNNVFKMLKSCCLFLDRVVEAPRELGRLRRLAENMVAEAEAGKNKEHSFKH